MADCIDAPPAPPKDDWIEKLIGECDLDRHRVRGGIPSFADVRLTAGMTDVSVLTQLAYTTLTEAVRLYSNRSALQY